MSASRWQSANFARQIEVARLIQTQIDFPERATRNITELADELSALVIELARELLRAECARRAALS